MCADGECAKTSGAESRPAGFPTWVTDSPERIIVDKPVLANPSQSRCCATGSCFRLFSKINRLADFIQNVIITYTRARKASRRRKKKKTIAILIRERARSSIRDVVSQFISVHARIDNSVADFHFFQKVVYTVVWEGLTTPAQEINLRFRRLADSMQTIHMVIYGNHYGNHTLERLQKDLIGFILFKCSLLLLACTKDF